MLAIATRSDESAADASGEIATAIDRLLDPPATLERQESLALPSGEWTECLSGRCVHTAMGMVFGNDSFIALAESAAEPLPALADAYNRTLLGFFITPDNSPYLALGLAATFIILGLLIAWQSVLARARAAERLGAAAGLGGRGRLSRAAG